ncbi:MAG: inosine-uridine nucleoside N-ribohydrolase [Halieaceae bacterium]|jgi:inosine-uridine nucleoside N-ribohydrolase
MKVIDNNLLTRRTFVGTSIALAFAANAGTSAISGDSRPVIMDTDIGDDIDDTWALIMLLRMPALDLKLAVGDFGNAMYRARLLAKLLELTGRSDVPVGIGLGVADEPGQQSSWLGDYQLNDYPGEVYEDGVQAIIDTIKSSPEPVTLICLGPVPNIAEALRRDPSIASNAHFIGMYGSIYKGYLGDEAPAAEYNVRVDPASLQAAFAAPWECTITPLDTCGLVVLDGDDYRRLYQSDDPWLRLLMANYRAWLPGAPFIAADHDMSKVSTTLFDSVAVHLAAEGDLVEMERLPIRVTDDGYTIIDRENGRPVNCATAWKDLEAFKQRLVNTLSKA